MTIEFLEDLLGQLVNDIDAAAWHVDGEHVDVDELVAHNGFMPLWCRVAANNALEAGLIESLDDFPLCFEQSDTATFGVSVSLVPERLNGYGLSASSVCLILMDAIHQTIALNDRQDLDATRHIDLSKALHHLEMSDALDNSPQPSL